MKTTLALLAVLSAVAAGCSSDDPSPPAAGAAATTSASKPASRREQGVKFAECVRSHGVADFPDPDAKGDFDYGVSVSPTVWTKAVAACKDLQPPGTLSSKRTRKEQSAALRFAACVRAHGVEDFPDPVDGEPLINTYEIPSSNRPGGMDILNAAVARCRQSMRDALSGR